MAVLVHPHAKQRALERGATEQEIIETVLGGISFPARLGRTGFKRDFPFAGIWRGRTFGTKQLEVYAVLEVGDWLVITVITRYF